MSTSITTTDLSELTKLHDIKRGTYPEFTNLREARVAFAQAMQARGFWLDANRTWRKAGRAAVMEP